jgi:hypothetical protein
MWREEEEDVERLLRPESRAGLPFGRLLLLYLHPFALFKDASRGSVLVQRRALSYNRAMRWMLLWYLQRWMVIAAALFLAIAPAEAQAAQISLFIIPTVAFAVGACIALTVIACTAIAYLLLGARRN